jgi:phosphocarrier protein HPr
VQEAIIIVTDPMGLHARPAALLVQTAGQFKSQIYLYLAEKDRQADARSIMQLLRLGVREGDILKIITEGDEAKEALAAVLAVMVGTPVS